MSKKSSRPSGAEKIREKNKLLLKAAGQSPNQKSLLDCFQKSSQVAKKELPINDELSNEPSAEVLTDNSLPKATDPDEVEVGNASCDQPFLIPKKDPLSVASFLHLHPIQPTTCRQSSVFVRSCGNMKVPRRWLSYNIATENFHCVICMAFCVSPSVWQTGCAFDNRHATTRVKEHESSDVHITAAEAYLRFDRTQRIENLINKEQTLLRISNVRNNQDIVKRIVNWVLCIGRQGIAYRGNFESTKYWTDKSVNPGNLLEIIRTASQQDEKLRSHLEKCLEVSSYDDIDVKGPRGRGRRVTYLSKSTFNKLIIGIGDSMKKTIVNEIKSCGFYSLMVDSTQDVSGYEQCSLVVRYINKTTFDVEEKFIGILKLTDTTGLGYLNAIVPYLEELGIPVALMVACSFDGASNMRSDEKGLQARLKLINELIVYTWCFAHTLNLSVCDTVSCNTSARNLFGLLQSTHNFCAASYKRVLEWEKVTKTLAGRKKLIRFENFGKTRWFSNEKSVTKIFGSYQKTNTEVYLAMLQFLHTIKTSKSFEAKVCFEAGALLDNWTKLETILTAFSFLKIFEILGPVSKYFQTKGCDLMAALGMSKTAISDVGKYRSSFDQLKGKAITFSKTVNDSLIDEDFSVNEDLLTKRVRNIKRFPDEKARHEAIDDAWKNFKVNEFLVIIDSTTQTLTDRFNSVQNEKLVHEMSYFYQLISTVYNKNKVHQVFRFYRVCLK
ncbi:Zinc finger MYM-type protein 1 [Pseudolycoriella hygida]|uniref:Zinc finger MYM-type protein 1 n=1 Tax=Pseudolycoriella hygida TaxID=35572 RepID=A0A9Q0NHP9_9DIPT|nr:Zinc finger MYM-type protein 1 [Pseudolycoriella hygida]